MHGQGTESQDFLKVRRSLRPILLAVRTMAAAHAQPPGWPQVVDNRNRPFSVEAERQAAATAHAFGNHARCPGTGG